MSMWTRRLRLFSPTASAAAANFAGKIWTALVSLALVPVYIHFLGIETYGLLGFFASVQALLTVFDFGLGGTLSRELARAAESQELRRTSATLVRTIEVVYWAIGAVCLAALLLLAAPLAESWLNVKAIPRETLYHAVILMAISFFFQWPIALYSGGLLGCQNQVSLNAINIAAVTIRGVGSVVVLWLVSRSIEAFLLWQIASFMLQTGALALVLWRAMPPTQTRARIELGVISRVGRFAGNLGVAGLASLLLFQLDKVVLSKFLPLAEFGHYMLASVFGLVLRVVSAPITDAMLPRYYRSIERADGRLPELFHTTCQLVAGLVFPLGAVLALFSGPVLVVWIGDPETVTAVRDVATLIVIGQMLLVLLEMLDLLQLAHGWLKPTYISRFIALAALVPMMLYAAPRYGATGAAVVWIIIYAASVAITPYFVFGRLLRDEKWRWYLRDGLVPLALALMVSAAWRYVLPGVSSRWGGIGQLLLVGSTTFVIVALSLPAYRHLFNTLLQRTMTPRD